MGSVPIVIRAHFKTPLARHAETRSVSEGLQTKQFQRHPSLTRRVTKGFEMRSSQLVICQLLAGDMDIENPSANGTLTSYTYRIEGKPKYHYDKNRHLKIT
jgi:hypothetical protein